MIKLSIIMGAYNEERFIRTALSSIPFTDEIEVIVVNDGSTDKTAEIAKEFPIKLIDRKENLGLGYSRKEGIAAAKGKYLMFFDADDTINQENFKKAFDMIDGKTDLIFFDLIQNDGVVLHLDPETKHIYPGNVKFIKRSYMNKYEYPLDRKYEDVYFNPVLIGNEHTEKFTNLIVVNYNFPREDSTSAKWARGEL